MKALCCILNYNVNDNANYLYQEFNKYCEAHVIDSNSKNPYPYFENVGNFYYTNLFNKSIEKFKKGNYSNLILITSDVQISHEAIEYICNFVNNMPKEIGIWALQTDKSSRDSFNSYKINLPDSYQTECIEGFFQVIHHDIVMNHKLIPLTINKYGVCIDQYSAQICKKLNKKLIIDTKFTIHHPKDRGYNYNEAHKQDNIFFKWYRRNINKL